MSELLKTHQILLGLVLFFVVTLFWGHYYTLLVISTLIVMYFFYFLFYTNPPKVREYFMTIGVVLGVMNFVFPLSMAISGFVLICSLECGRVVVMAILRYPTTIQDLQTLTEKLEHRVNERTVELQETNQRLKVANDRLRELDQMKSAFVSQASHDLRTPLTAIKGSLDNLSLGIAGELNEKQKKILDRATRSVDRLTHLINDILDLSRIESGRTVLEKTKVSLRMLVEQSILENKPAADQRRIALSAHAMTEPYPIFADGGKIERVIGELLGNAIKYTPEGGTVRLQVTRDENRVILSVHDSGIGMSVEDSRRIFERFYRSSASQHFAKGSGLGLSIAKELVELHGGSISVESTEGKGTTFTVRLLPG